jgi:hypothetical protein
MLANFRAETLVKGKILLNAVLLALVAGLALWMTMRPGSTPVATQRLSALKAADVNTIRIARNGLPEIVLEREGKRWVQTAPFRARTDATQAGRLLDLLGAQAAVTFPAEDLARFELDKPFATVTIGNQVFAFGMMNSMTNEQYVLSGKTVYLVPAVFAYGLPTRADSLTTHMLLAEDEVPVRFELPGVTLTSKDGKWTRSDDDKASQDDLARWVEEWRFASSLATQATTGTPKGEPVRIGLANGRTLDLVIVKREPEFVLARPDDHLQFVFGADKAARLLAPPGPAAGK